MVYLEPGYITLLQKPYCCSVACLQMILYRNGLGLHDQEVMALKFGVKINEKFARAFTPQMPTARATDLGYGIRTIESASHINSFLKECDFPLHVESWNYSTIKSLPAFLELNIRNGNDLWVEYHANKIHASDDDGGRYLHDGLIEGFDSSSGKVVVIDPVPTHRQRLDVHLHDLEESVSSRYGTETGFIVVRRLQALERQSAS